MAAEVLSIKVRCCEIPIIEQPMNVTQRKVLELMESMVGLKPR